MVLITLVCHSFKVRTIQVEKKISEVVNRLNKTKEEKVVNLRELREERDQLEREGNKKKLREQVCLLNYTGYSRNEVQVIYPLKVKHPGGEDQRLWDLVKIKK